MNTAASYQGSRSGLYEETTPVNGKQSWTSVNGNAIWRSASIAEWVIGTASGIGGNIGGLFSNDPSDPDSNCPQQVSKWNVYNGNAKDFVEVASSDVSFECYELKGT